MYSLRIKLLDLFLLVCKSFVHLPQQLCILGKKAFCICDAFFPLHIMIHSLRKHRDTLCSCEYPVERINIFETALRKYNAFEQRRAVQFSPGKIFDPFVLLQQFQSPLCVPALFRQHPSPHGQERIFHPIAANHNVGIPAFAFRYHCGNHIRFDIIVAVHEHVIIAVCNAHARIAGTALPLIGLVKTDQRRMGSGIMITDLAARVSGSVIDQDDFRIGIALCQ